MYYRIESNIYDDYGIERNPELPWGVSFQSGHLIQKPLPAPLVFSVDYTEAEPPRHYVDASIPIMSSELVTILNSSGVDNLQLFDAVLLNEETGKRWTEGFHAVNIIGLISCAVLDQSDHTRIGGRPGGAPPLVHFHNLVIDPKRASGQLLFRLAESPHTILMHEKVFDAIPDRPPPGWNITAFYVDEI